MGTGGPPARPAVLTVTSTRMQGVGAGVVSLGFAELLRRVSYRPRDALSVLVVAVEDAAPATPSTVVPAPVARTGT